jgi:hypothetical protein
MEVDMVPAVQVDMVPAVQVDMVLVVRVATVVVPVVTEPLLEGTEPVLQPVAATVEQPTVLEQVRVTLAQPEDTQVVTVEQVREGTNDVHGN